MGGPGSGRRSLSYRLTVDDCRAIDVNDLNREGCLTSGNAGTLMWRRGEDGEVTATVGWTVTGDDRAGRAIMIFYTVTDLRSDGSRSVKYWVPLVYTECHLGGERPWFRCPGPRGGTCGERVGKLYRPPGRDRFLCRHCYDLRYESRQRSGEFFFENVSKPMDREQEAIVKLKDGPITPEKLREVYDARKSWLRGLRLQHQQIRRIQSNLPGVPDDHPVLRLPSLPPFEEWADDLLHQAYGSPGGRAYGIYGRCEATAKTTGERCRQPATGNHGKCYYHGGAPGAGAPEGNRNAALEAD